MILNDLEHDILTEIATIGGGNASEALSKLLKQKVFVKVPDVRTASIEGIPDLMGTTEQIMTTVAIKISGDATGVVVFLFTPEDAKKLASEIMQTQTISVVEEIANILVGNSLTALSQFLQMKFSQSVPLSATDMLRAVINEIMSELGGQTDTILLLKISFMVNTFLVGGSVYFLFDPTSTEKILNACKQKTAVT
ncbi:MAG TPA: chemotaxis protein CheC [Methylomirabilota bacterium]|nr:chemotaxis protein CheC [Methylomirabilota bacterium]